MRRERKSREKSRDERQRETGGGRRGKGRGCPSHVLVSQAPLTPVHTSYPCSLKTSLPYIKFAYIASGSLNRFVLFTADKSLTKAR